MGDQSDTRQNDRHQDNPDDLDFDIDENESPRGQNLPTHPKLNISNKRKNKGSNGKSRIETG